MILIEGNHYCNYLVYTFEPVPSPVHVIHTGLQIERSHPLAIILSPLRPYLGDFHWSTKVHFEPLVVIVVSCAPGPHVLAALDLTQSPESRGVELINFR